MSAGTGGPSISQGIFLRLHFLLTLVLIGGCTPCLLRSPTPSVWWLLQPESMRAVLANPLSLGVGVWPGGEGTGAGWGQHVWSGERGQEQSASVGGLSGGGE